MKEHFQEEKIKYLIRAMMKLKYRFYIQQRSSIYKRQIRVKFVNRFISRECLIVVRWFDYFYVERKVYIYKITPARYVGESYISLVQYLTN